MKTAHRKASRAKRSRVTDPQALPKFWRPKLTTSQQTECQLVHWDVINRFTSGAADSGDMWDWVETGFTYRKLMDLLRQDGTDFTPEAEAAIDEQLGIYEAVAARYARTGRAGFSATELLVARAAASVFDSLVELDRNGLAQAAARWSIEKMAAISREQVSSGTA